ncbi:hypothetical protein HOLleu_16505 [Holothuria leucospilota]|uniref:Uncharacterized protein n=1 Tax=Holothuria leucospilota TaxID=206669 RepID=A0A9Q1HAG5_HOLLE|nr:hypothetical protein HOLleu_16505 [Holothuria leucospilota]
MCQKFMSVGILDARGRFVGGQVQRTSNNKPVTYAPSNSFRECVCEQLLEGNLHDVNGYNIRQRFIGISERGWPVCLATESTT